MTLDAGGLADEGASALDTERGRRAGHGPADAAEAEQTHAHGPGARRGDSNRDRSIENGAHGVLISP